MCGDKKSFATQQAILSLIKTRKKVINRKRYRGAVLLDLSKALGLLLAKLHACIWIYE